MRLRLIISTLAICALTACNSIVGSGQSDLPSPTLVPISSGKRSAPVPADLRAMWSVKPKKEGRSWVTATDEAIDASERIFNAIDLRGQSTDQIAKTLRLDLRAEDYGYYAPFWPVESGVLPIRIDNGGYGWQYDIYFTDDRVSKVLRRWIH